MYACKEVEEITFSYQLKGGNFYCNESHTLCYLNSTELFSLYKVIVNEHCISINKIVYPFLVCGFVSKSL